jgi:protein-disulfide isomerase
MEDIRRWEATKNGSGTEMIIMSDGDPELHRKLAIKTPILIDKGYKTSAKLGISGTPSAVLIDEDARFASETAIGASNIWALIERKKSDA